MKIRVSRLYPFLFLFSIAIATALLNSSQVKAQVVIEHGELTPAGGGRFESVPTDQITDEQRLEIQMNIRRNIENLEREGRLEPARPEAVPLAWPLAKASGVTDFFVEGISNYVDQNLLFPNQLRDWNCGSRTYDQANGYNHAGIDIFTWPFSWKKVDDNSVEIRAAAPGTIIFKSDGNFDRNCAFGNGDWNAVYVRHGDNSVAWYGHMKNGSLTSKIVGDTVVAGEKLGIVGSSGNSTGPHLHFELYNANNQLQDPFQGTCNTMNATSWWIAQEPYRNSRLNALKTQSGPPVFPTCPATETTNEKTVFQRGETIYTAAYYRDQLTGQQTLYSLIDPNGTTVQSWSGTSAQIYDASYWWWSWPIAANAVQGNWKFRAVYNSVTYETPFVVGQASATISGKVTTPSGGALRNVVVSLIDSANVRRTATTSSFGLFSFENVATGASYTMAVASKRYRFSPQVLQVNGNLTGVDFVGLE
ncbi:MAG: peptidoglycan DD-metalloendopeptidase family protein [Pyrinomonadaceae bacterium]